MNFDQLKNDVSWLRGEDGVVAPVEAVRVLRRILKPLLAEEGFDVFENDAKDLRVDLVAKPNLTKDSESQNKGSVAIEYKHFEHGKPITVNEIDQLIKNIGAFPYERAMLIGRFGFTKSATERAKSLEPIRLELLDLTGIEAWIHRLEIGKPTYIEQVQVLIRSISHEFAKLVSQSPDALDELEWRDLERMMARVMIGLGFECTLTPLSKDGGKDLILYWRTTNGDQSFIVELKHWRSRQRVGKSAVKDFMNVIITEDRTKGLFLSTYGYTADKTEGLTEITRNRLKFGEKNKIVLLAKTYIRACNGLWSPPNALPDVLFEDTE